MVIEKIIDDGRRVKHYSSISKKIRQVETDFVFDEAIDVMPCKYTYEETNIPVD